MSACVYCPQALDKLVDDMHSTASSGAAVHGSLVPQETIEQVHHLAGRLTCSACTILAVIEHHVMRLASTIKAAIHDSLRQAQLEVIPSCCLNDPHM